MFCVAEHAGDLREHARAILDGEAQVIFRNDCVERLAGAVEAVRHEAVVARAAIAARTAASARSAITELDVGSWPAPRP